MNLRMKIFEGPDCCGKSTQADLLMTKLDDCMLIHFPLLKTTKQSVDVEFFKKDPSSNVALAIKNLNETLYSDEYIKSDIPISDKNLTITNNMKNNIISNATNKFLFVTYLNEYIDPEYTEEELHNSYKYLDFDSIILRLRLHGKEVTENKFEALMDYRKEMIFDPEFKEKLFTIVLDRFFVSGRFYNLEMPLAIYRKKMVNVFSTKNEFDYYYDILEKTLRNVYDTGEKELLGKLQSSLIKYNYNHSNSFDEQKMSLSLLPILEIFKFANILPFVHSYIFMPSECIRKKVLEGSRNTDAYDKNKDMQLEISLLYGSLRGYFLPINDTNKYFVNDRHTNDNMIYYASAMPDIDNLLTVSKKDPKFVIREVHEAVMRNADFINYGRYIQAFDRRSSNIVSSRPLFSL